MFKIQISIFEFQKINLTISKNRQVEFQRLIFEFQG